MDKPHMQTRTSVQPYNSLHHPRHPWSPVFIQRIPWLGLGAILGSLVGLGACVAILIASDGQSITAWTIQPSVYLAIAVPIINLLLAFALSQGVDISWWRKAMTTGTTVADLHRTWDFGRSFVSAVLAGRHTNLVAIASVLVVVAQINSPLLQRASRVIQARHSSTISVQLLASPNLPDSYYTGYLSGRAYNPTVYTSQYTPVVAGFNANSSFPIPHGHGCTGTCKGRMRGVGLATSCSLTSRTFNLEPNTQLNSASDPVYNGTDVFYTNIAWRLPDPKYINISTLYKDTHDCVGSLSMETCSLQVATVNYNVVIDGNASTIKLDPDYNIWSDEVVNITTNHPSLIQGPNAFAGYYRALLDRYNSTAHLSFSGAVGYTLYMTGSLPTQYAVLDTSRSAQAYDGGTNCTLAFTNPMNDVLAGARDLMFRTSLAVAQYNSSFAQTQITQASQTSAVAVFHSNYAYLGGAVAITLLAMCVVTAAFRGFSELGRAVTLSPIEIAKAFNAPILRNEDSNEPVGKLIRDVGQRSVKYGAVMVGGTDQYGRPIAAYGEPNYKLCLADEDIVADPREGQVFVG